MPATQLNDCWPVTSWAIVDYFNRPKPAYFAAKRALAPYVVGIKRRHIKVYDDPRSVLYKEHHKVEIWGSNLTSEHKKVHLRVEAVDHLSGEVLYSDLLEITLKANQSTEFRELEVPFSRDCPDRAVVFQARLIDAASNEVLSRSQDYPEP
jgi:beta-mannosidase